MMSFLFIIIMVIFYVYQSTRNIAAVFAIIMSIGMFVVIMSPDFNEIERTLDELFIKENVPEDDIKEEIPDAEPRDLGPIFYVVILSAILFLPLFIIYSLFIVPTSSYRRKKKSYKYYPYTSRRINKYKEKRKSDVRKATFRNIKSKLKSQHIIKAPPKQIGDYNLVEDTSTSITDLAKNYKQSGYWTQLYNFDESTFLYISNWTRLEKGVYGRPIWDKTA